MLFQNVIRHTINLLAEAEREAALQQRLRVNVRNESISGNVPPSHPVRNDRRHRQIRINAPSDIPGSETDRSPKGSSR